MWLMPLRSLSNCDYELYFYLRLILGPIHSNQVMGTDPVGSYHGTRNSRSNSINPTYPYQSHDLKMPPRHTHVPPVQNNQPGTGFRSRGKSVGLGPSVTPLGWLSAPRINARGAIWAHIQIWKLHSDHGFLAMVAFQHHAYLASYSTSSLVGVES